MIENRSGKIIGLLFNTTAWIVAPVLFGIFVGKYLDEKFQTEPWLFLMSIGVCFTISMFGLIQMALKEFKKIEEGSQKNEKE